MAFHMALHSKSPEINLDYPEGIDLRGYEVALKSFVGYNNIPNIGPHLHNNTLQLIKDCWEVKPVDDDDVVTEEEENYTVLTHVDKPVASRTFMHHEYRGIVLDTGCYELKDVENAILRDKMHKEHKTEMFIDFVLMRVGIRSLWILDFSAPNSIGPTLGFEKKMYPPTGIFIWSTKPIDLFSIHNIRIKSNLTCCNIQDSKLHDSTLYEIFPRLIRE